MLKITKKHILSAAGVVVIINLVLVAFLLSIKISSSSDNFDKIADPNTYQAIFLSNDQIYFGHLKSENQKSEYLTLTDVYYIKVGEDSVGQLVKLGQIEPHKPTNEMIINREHVLFWENLSPDSPVVRTIQGYK
ncbi:MAG: hypothetical protein Q8Q89_01070 [bacterium]|nr:hypothetical protein [bacterium]